MAFPMHYIVYYRWVAEGGKDFKVLPAIGVRILIFADMREMINVIAPRCQAGTSSSVLVSW